MTLGIALAALGLLAFQATPRARASDVPDASCAGPPESFQTNTGTSRTAQTFTAQNTGTLTSAQLEVFKTGTAGDWIVDILDTSAGIPVDGVLATATVPDTTVPSGGSLITANFGTPASVIAGDVYALEFSRPASNTTGEGERDGDGSDCPGQLFGAVAAPGTFSAAGHTGADLVFSITVNAIEHLLTVNKAGTGTGTVTGTGIGCGSDCSESYNSGSSVILTATPSPDSSFGGWTGCDTPSGNNCTMSVDADKSVTATFTANPTETPPGVTPQLPTGERAAALKKCKKKHSHKARKKCRKKAHRLPL
jgi:List-Bact-rpt repeat protein